MIVEQSRFNAPIPEKISSTPASNPEKQDTSETYTSESAEKLSSTPEPIFEDTRKT